MDWWSEFYFHIWYIAIFSEWYFEDHRQKEEYFQISTGN